MTNLKPSLRIGIVTYHFSDNFGALLQAYALRRWFAERGHRAEFIPYHPTHVEQGGTIRFSMKGSALRSNAKTIYLKVSSLLHKHFGNTKQAVRFASFREQQLGIAGDPLRHSTELATVAGRYDLIVAGSDQIWSPSTQHGFDPAYFLDFAKDSAARRSSYAASFGRDSLSKDELRQLAPLLDTLTSISVRERSGLEIIREAAGRDADCVPDPTLLHDHYDELLKASGDTREGHVFCYALRTAEVIREVAEAASRFTSAAIISPYNVHRRWREIGQTVHPGPAEWVGQLAKARFVVTNSFHGTVFSILFRKPFLVAELPGSRSAMNSRSRNLLTQLGLMDRFVSMGRIPDLERLIALPIDWSEVDRKREFLRQSGVRFLEDELKQAAQS